MADAVVVTNAGPLIALGKLNRREVSVRPDIWISGKLCEQVLASLRTTDNQGL